MRDLSWLRIKAVARRHTYVLARSPYRLFDVTVWPVVDVILFGSLAVFSQQSGSGRLAFAYILSGIVLWHVIYQAQIGLSTGFLEETWSRNLLNLMVTPLKEVEYALGVALFGIAKLVVGVGLVALIAFVFYAFDVTELGLSLIPIGGVLLVVGWAIALFVVALVLRFGSGAEALVWGILFVVLPLSGVFYPLAALPAVLRPVALALPTTHAFAATRNVINGDGLPWDLVALAGGSTLVLLGAAVAFLAWMLQLFRRRGYITRYS